MLSNRPNIKRFRMEKGFKVYELAQLVGLSPNYLGRIERGLNSPTIDVVTKIARALNISIEDLFSPEPHNSFIHYRGKEKASPKLLYKIPQIIHIYQQVESLCQAGHYRSFPLDIPLTGHKENDIEEAARLTRKLLCIDEASNLDLFSLLEDYGVRIISYNLPAKTSGFSYGDKNLNSITLFINKSLSAERQIYTLIHELGHIIFDEGGFKHGKKIKDNKDDCIEFSATRFAANFLLPARIIHLRIKQYGIEKNHWDYSLLLEIKKHFGVSAEALLHRLNDLKLISRKNYTDILTNINAFYKKNSFKEPGGSLLTSYDNNRLKILLAIIERKKIIAEDEIKLLKTKLNRLGISLS